MRAVARTRRWLGPVLFGAWTVVAGCRERPANTERVTTEARGAATGSVGTVVSGRPARGRCPGHTPPVARGRVTESAIDEASGLVASRSQAGVLWVHNDSGDSPRVFALSDEGRLAGTFSVTGASAFDWEDIAIARRGEVWDLLVGDLGDNATARADVVVYRFEEPRIVAGAPPTVRATAAATTLRFRYGDGAAHDAEALAVDPRGGDLYVVTKETRRPAVIFRARAPFDSGGVLERVGEVDVGAGHGKGHRVTAADVSADGRWILLRTYLKLLLFERREGEQVATALGRAPCELPPPGEPQGEAAAFSQDGRGVFTTSELTGQPLHFVAFDP